ncbi:MAG: type II secretion system protein [Patescibacteria group bacterium]|nr:type II secretion system protein [Patescibacteria group bacterium]
MFKNKKGFTLIEMMVVIGVIGILAALVLTALGPSRDKAKDVRIIAAINQLRSLAEVQFNSTTGNYEGIAASGVFAQLEADVAANFPGGFITFDGDDTPSYTASAPLNSGLFYCVDSTGFGGQTSTSTVSLGISCN